MSADKMELREILENNIGDVYKDALGILNDPAAAKDVTRRVMALLKRTYEAGLSVTPDMVKRVTEDCCKEQASYNSKKAAFRDGVIADMPDFDTAIASITGEEVRAKARSDAEEKAIEAHEAMRRAEVLQTKPTPPSQPVEQEAPRKRHTCVADIFEENNGEPIAETASEETAQQSYEKPAKEQRKRLWNKDDYDDDDYDDDDEDYDDDDIDDEEYESLFEKKEKAPLLPVIGVWILIALLVCVAFCLVMMLMQRGVLPGGSSGFVKNFAGWFNSHLFPLF